MTGTETARYPPFDGTQPCAAEDPELFFPHGSAQSHYGTERALNCCRSCPFVRPCLAYALTHAVRGVWGATTWSERQALRREHGITAEPVSMDFYTPSERTEQITSPGAGGGGG